MVVMQQRNILHKFRKQKLALLGLSIISVFILAGIFAPLVSPHDPYAVDLTIKLLN